MAQQHSVLYPHSQGNSTPRILPTEFSAGWSPNLIPAEMARNGSKDSAYWSAGTEASDEYYQKPSPSATVAYSTGSPALCETDSLFGQQYEQNTYQDEAPIFTRSNSTGSNFPRTTLSDLTLTEESLMNFYKFVIPKGNEPYFELVVPAYWDPYNMPGKVYLDSPISHKKSEFPCMYPGCDAKTFKRPADLERHYRNVHGTSDQKDNFFCDYSPCKARGAFTRKDHFRDHLRDYHKEDIGSMKKSDKKNPQKLDEKKWVYLQAEWVAERKIGTKWWRCPKCLERIQIAESGYDCQSCKSPCDRERKQRIEAVRTIRSRATYAAPASSTSAAMDGGYEYIAPASAVPTITYPADSNCVNCGGTGYSPGSWDPCLSCQPVEQYYADNSRWEGGAYTNSSRY
ncbi:hypothetical protein D0Z07_1164 [Hyphodiscus hymeniophilus]|uniref:C2H2-type domain-containing protein n=1 Tax=Hyphodiscus hymeniophilus TaxID=353542 RepID=A0A9P6VQI3_9HELO|nr:hypothetical protein D0Z07_1164 [Hyphodiscus hymeniophilus]